MMIHVAFPSALGYFSMGGGGRCVYVVPVNQNVLSRMRSSGKGSCGMVYLFPLCCVCCS